jgi:uncharacterized protein involved in exopolysaccharide biosynthesis
MSKTSREGTIPARRRSVEPPPKERFEVLLEEIRGDVKTALEGHQVLRKEIGDLRQDMNERFEAVDASFVAVNARIDGLDQSLNAKIDSVDQSLNAKINGVNQSLNAKIDSVAKGLDAKIDAVAGDLNAKIDTVAKGLSAEIHAVAKDLAAHRADTEVHGGKYKVAEG